MTSKRLIQVLAVEHGRRTRMEHTFTALHHLSQRESLFNGQTRTYAPKDDEQKLPPESVLVQNTVADLLTVVRREVGEMVDTTALKEWGNAKATADLVVDGDVLISQVPVTFLLWLEKQLTEILTFVSALPVLDPAYVWDVDAATGLRATKEIETAKTAKVPKVIVRYEATDKHPAQTDMVAEDVVVGYWTKRLLSGALPAQERDAIAARVVRLRDATKEARETANLTEVEEVAAAKPVFDFLFGKAVETRSKAR